MSRPSLRVWGAVGTADKGWGRKDHSVASLLSPHPAPCLQGALDNVCWAKWWQKTPPPSLQVNGPPCHQHEKGRVGGSGPMHGQGQIKLVSQEAKATNPGLALTASPCEDTTDTDCLKAEREALLALGLHSGLWSSGPARGFWVTLSS